MPIFLYRNPNTNELKEIIQSVHEEHKYSENGIEFIREFTVPNTSIDSKIDPNNPKDFVKYTANKAGSLGDLQDLSSELSKQRADKNGGLDPVAEANYQKYKEIRKREHPNVRKRKMKEKLKDNKFLEIKD